MFTGAFDAPSIALWAAALTLICAVLFATHGKTRSLTAIGAFLDQSVALKVSCASLVAIFAGTVFSTMYKSVLISHLTRPELEKPLDSFSDLDGALRGMRVFVQSPSNRADMLRSSQRSLVEKGAFIFGADLFSPANMGAFLEGKLAFFDDLARAMTHQFDPGFNPAMNCRLAESNVHVSRNARMTATLSPIVRKGYGQKDRLALELMRMDQFGLPRGYLNVEDYAVEVSGQEMSPCPHVGSSVRKNTEKKGALEYCFPEKLVQRLSDSHFKLLYLVYFVGNIVAVGCFLFEFSNFFQMRLFEASNIFK